MVDHLAHELFIVSPTGALLSMCGTAVFGSTVPVGIAYNSTSGFYAIVDPLAGEVFIVDGACVIQSQFDTSVVGAIGLQGITYRPDTDSYGAIRASVSGLGTLVNQFSFASTLNFPLGLAFNPDDRVSAVLDGLFRQVLPIDHRGTLVSTFDTVAFGSGFPSNLAFNTSTGNLLITDTLNRFVYKVTIAGASTGFCAAGTLANDIKGVAYLPATNQFAYADRIDDEIFITSTDCIRSAEFDTANINSDTHSGLRVDLIFGDLTLTDSQDDTIRYTGTDGNLGDRCAGAALGFGEVNGGGPINGLFNILDMAHLSAAGNFAAVDGDHHEVVVFDTTCSPVLHFDTAALPATDPVGIAVDNGAKKIFIVDPIADEVYELDIPRVFEPTTLSGSFLSPGGITVNLKETEKGSSQGR